MIRDYRLKALGVMLCLLATLFAVEAKMASYNAAGVSASEISAGKLQPTEGTKALPLAVSSSVLIDTSIDDAMQMVGGVLSLLTATALFGILPKRVSVSASPSFSASLFFRPPPIR